MSCFKRFAVMALAVVCMFGGPALLRAQESEADESADGASEPAPEAMRDPDAVAAVEQGVSLMQQGNFKEAIGAFNKAIAIDATFVEAYIGKGDALRELKDYRNAMTAYTQALNINVNAVPAYIGRGEAAMEVGQVDIASTDFDTAMQLDPNNPRLLSDVGHLAVQQQDPVGAIQRLDDALAMNDQDARAYRDRGLAHVMLGEFDKAEADVRRAVELDPANHENFMVQANVYQVQNKHEQAIQAITQAINAYKPQRPGDPAVYVSGYLARANASLRLAEQEKQGAKAQGALQSVIADADALLAQSEDRPEAGTAFYLKGRALRMLQRYSDAVAAFTKAIEKASQDAAYLADAIYFRGICWYYLGEPELARGDFEQASSTGGGYQDPRIFLWIGYTHHTEGDYREAIDSYNEAIAKAPNLALAHVNKGRAYMDLREYRRAIESFNNAVRSEPTVGEHYYNVGYAYMRLREYRKAVDFFNLALQQENPQPKMYRMMATALRELGRDELAGQYEQRARQAEAQQQAAGG
jgi:tetratricopeptide (TPR) repeat protein